MTKKITPMEAELLNLLAYDLYNHSNGSRPTEFNDVSGGVWTWSISHNWPHSKRALSGVSSSLVKKGFVRTTVHVPDAMDKMNNATMGLTAEGFEAWQSVDSGRPAPVVQPDPAPEPAKQEGIALQDWDGQNHQEPYKSRWEQEQDSVKAAAAEFAATFRLYDNQGDTFRISVPASFMSMETGIQLVVQICVPNEQHWLARNGHAVGSWVDAFRATPQQIKDRLA